MNIKENSRDDTSLEGQVVHGPNGPEREGCGYEPGSCWNLRKEEGVYWCLLVRGIIPLCGKVSQEPK